MDQKSNQYIRNKSVKIKNVLKSDMQCYSALYHTKTIYTLEGFGMLRQSITGLFKQFWSDGKIACQGSVGRLNINQVKTHYLLIEEKHTDAQIYLCQGWFTPRNIELCAWRRPFFLSTDAFSDTRACFYPRALEIYTYIIPDKKGDKMQCLPPLYSNSPLSMYFWKPYASPVIASI